MVKLLAKLKAVFVTCFWMVTTHELSNKQGCLYAGVWLVV